MYVNLKSVPKSQKVYIIPKMYINHEKVYINITSLHKSQNVHKTPKVNGPNFLAYLSKGSLK